MNRWLHLLFALCGLAAASAVATYLLLQQNWAQLDELSGQVEQLAKREAALVREVGGESPPARPIAGVPAEVIWPGPDRSAVGLAIQAAIAELASGAGVEMRSMGLSASQLDLKQPTVAFDLEFEGDHRELVAFLQALEASRPPLAINYLAIRPLPANPSEAVVPVNVRMTVWIFTDIVGGSP